jgi:filamentous hemagglutinin family protein
MRALLVGVVLIWAAPVAAAPVADATWSTTPGSGDFNTASNWTPAFVPNGTAFFGASTITSLSFSTNTQLGGFTFNPGALAYSFSNSQILVFTGAGIVINGGSAAITNNSGGILQFSTGSTAGSAVITNNGGLVFNGTSTTGSTAGSAAITNNADLTFQGASTAGSAAITNTGGIFFRNNSTAGSAAITNNGSIQFGYASTAGSAAITNSNAGIVDFSSSSGPNNDHRLSAGSIAGGGSFYLGADQLTVGGNNLSTVVSGVISDCGGGHDCNAFSATGGSLVKTGTGTLTLSGINTYTGATTVNGGTLAGTGTVSATTVNNGGTLAPGNGTPGTSLAISGSLAFQSGAIYLVQVDPSTASFASATGAATPNGATVQAVFASGSYISKQYTILTAGSVSGAFGSLVNTNLPANFHDSLSYDATHAYLNLALNFGIPSQLNGNQQVVGNALTNFFNTNGIIPMVYAQLNAAGLTQASGESATGSQQTTFQAMGQFMGLLADPFMSHGGGINGATSAPGYADEEGASAYAAQKRLGAERTAYAMFAKAPLAKVYEPRWSVWAAGYGGSQTTSGNAIGGGERHHQPHRRHRGRRRLSVLAEHHRRICFGRRRHQFLGGEWWHGPLRSVPGGRLCAAHRGQRLHRRRAGLWLAGHHYRSQRNDCGSRPSARRVQCQCLVGAGGRRLSLCRAVGRRHRHHALRGGTVHHLRSAGLRRECGRRQPGLCPLLRGEKRHR